MSLNFGYIQKSGSGGGNFLEKSGGTMSGNIDMDFNEITDVGPAIIDDTYTTAGHAKDITVNGGLLYSSVASPLTTSSLSNIRNVEVNLEMNTTDMNAGFFLHQQGFGMFGRFDGLKGYLKEAQITVVKPLGTLASQKLTSVQMKISDADTPTTISTNISQKLTRSLTPGTYDITPLKTKFTNLKYIGFFFTGGDTIFDVHFKARLVLALV